jgi:hypothetical protein
MSPTRSPSFADLARGGPDAERERFEEEGYEENAEGLLDPATVRRPEGADDTDMTDVLDEAAAERERQQEQAETAAEGGRPGGESDEAPSEAEDDDAAEPREDPAAIDPQIERAESEGMVTEHAKVSAQDPGPEPIPEPEDEPEPDHGPGDDPEREAEEQKE